MLRIARGLVCATLAAALLVSLPASAEEFAKKLNWGVGFRAGAGTVITDPGTTVGVYTADIRPYISGSVTPWLKYEANLDMNVGDQARIRGMDLVGKLEFDELFNVWFGRFLPPSDRANLSGPYYQNAWTYPGTVNGYPSIYAGRADGAAVWGQYQGGKFKYQVGYFTLAPSKPENGIVAARAVVNLLDPEGGYYNSSTYYGAKEVLAIGGVVQYQKNGGGTTQAPENLVAFNFDVLFEKRVGADVVSVEGAYYNQNKGSLGHSFWALAGYLVGSKVGPGKLQPVVRYQHFIPSGGGDATKTIDAGVNYIVDGHSTRFALNVQNTSAPGVPSTTGIQVGLQIQQ